MAEPEEGTAVQDAPRAWIDDVVARIVGRVAPDEPSEVGPDDMLVADLGYNSILFIELAFALEELFQLESLTFEDVPPTGSVRQIQEYIAEKVAAGSAVAPSAAAVDEFLQAV